MIDFFRKAPFLKLILIFVYGIIFRLYIYVNPKFILPFLIITVILWFGLILLNKISKNIQNQLYFGFLVNIFLFLFGILITGERLYTIENQYFPENKQIELNCTLQDYPDERSKSFKCYVEAQDFKYNDTLFNCNNKLMLYLEKSGFAEKLKPGDQLKVRAKIQRIKTFENNQGFDYAKYMFKQGILYSAYAKNNFWEKTDSNKISKIQKTGFSCRTGLLKLLSQAGLKGNDYAVASALTIGYRADMDKEIRDAYSATGTMHILAVSGMHVGLLYLVLSFLMGFWEQFKNGIYIKSAIIIILIWFYAFLCGLSPSILRSAIMITFIGLGQTLKRQSFIFNSIALSSFLILLYDPLQITDVGFQLSYAAVIGIVIFYPIIYKWLFIKNKIADYFWQLVAVSAAAQLLTFPLTIYYFKQFPVYFPLSNILAVPVSTITMYTALLLVGISFVPYSINFIGIILQYIVNLQNKIVIWIQHLPGSQISDLKINITDVILWYILILFFSLTLIKRKAIYIIITLSTILAFQLKGLFEMLVFKTN